MNLVSFVSKSFTNLEVHITRLAFQGACSDSHSLWQPHGGPRPMNGSWYWANRTEHVPFKST